MNELYFQMLRWIHFLSGITWIGLLYYFNFVQGPFLAEAEAAVKSEITKKLLPRALWWFRWGAMITLIAGLLMLMDHQHQYGSFFWSTPRGIYILIGSLLGIIMWFNVWFIIWPNQKVIIDAARGTGSKDVGNRPRIAFLASRTNTLLSIPMLFFMGASPHASYLF